MHYINFPAKMFRPNVSIFIAFTQPHPQEQVALQLHWKLPSRILIAMNDIKVTLIYSFWIFKCKNFSSHGKSCNDPDLLQESLGVSLGPFAPLALECPKSVPRVSPECQKGVPDTLGTLSGHFLDTPEPGARRAPETPRGTLPGPLRARRARETPVAGRGRCKVREKHKFPQKPKTLSLWDVQFFLGGSGVGEGSGLRTGSPLTGKKREGISSKKSRAQSCQYLRRP